MAARLQRYLLPCLLSEIQLELEILPIGGLFSFENFSRASQSLIVAKAKILSQYHLFSDT